MIILVVSCDAGTTTGSRAENCFDDKDKMNGKGKIKEISIVSSQAHRMHQLPFFTTSADSK